MIQMSLAIRHPDVAMAAGSRHALLPAATQVVVELTFEQVQRITAQARPALVT